EDLSSRAIVRHALAQDAPVGPDNFSVLRVRGRYFQIGCVPLVLQGYIIGSLTLGDRIDQGFVERLHRSFDSEIVVSGGGRVLGSSLSASAWPRPPASARDGDAAAEAAPVVTIGGEEFVTAPLILGTDDAERPVTLHLLHSLTRALDDANRSLLKTLLGY